MHWGWSVYTHGCSDLQSVQNATCWKIQQCAFKKSTKTLKGNSTTRSLGNCGKILFLGTVYYYQGRLEDCWLSPYFFLYQCFQWWREREDKDKKVNQGHGDQEQEQTRNRFKVFSSFNDKNTNTYGLRTLWQNEEECTCKIWRRGSRGEDADLLVTHEAACWSIWGFTKRPVVTDSFFLVWRAPGANVLCLKEIRQFLG